LEELDFDSEGRECYPVKESVKLLTKSIILCIAFENINRETMPNLTIFTVEDGYIDLSFNYKNRRVIFIVKSNKNIVQLTYDSKIKDSSTRNVFNSDDIFQDQKLKFMIQWLLESDLTSK
jgi:hypothetical protein